jgi:hypothetical protein
MKPHDFFENFTFFMLLLRIFKEPNETPFNYVRHGFLEHDLIGATIAVNLISDELTIHHLSYFLLINAIEIIAALATFVDLFD